MNVWTEHRNPEGRTYWFNTSTKESVWEKPDDLKTPFERALNATKWKEYFSGGRKYYYNTETKESKWEMPEELTKLKDSLDSGAPTDAPPSDAAQATPGFSAQMQGALVPMGGPDTSSFLPGSQAPIGLDGMNGAVGMHTGGLPLGALPARPGLTDDPVIPHNGFVTFEEGEKAFTHLLRKAGVDANWTWDQTMRTIITDPLYKALSTLAEKKAAWQKYTESLKAKETEEREARLAKLRPAIRNMLKGNPNVFPYTTFKTADTLFAQHPIWQQARIEAERKLIFEDYVAELKQADVQQQRVAHGRAVSQVVNLFKDLQVDVTTKWRQAHQRLLESDEFAQDKELQGLPSLDILLAFEDYSRLQEREFEEQMRRSTVAKNRKERKAREAFKGLLQELINTGHIKARTKWKTIYPTFANDERYIDMLGNPGSNPLELFWDVVDDLDSRLDAKISHVEAALKTRNADAAEPFEVTPETTMEQLLDIVKDNAKVRELSTKELEDVYYTMHDDAVKKQEDDRRRAERKQRHLQDDLRYALRKLPDAIDVDLSYEDAVPLMESLSEFKALEDEGRRAAFSKFIKRQKERMRDVSDDGGSATGRRRKEPARDHRNDRDRDHDRRGSYYDQDDSRSGTGGGYRGSGKDREHYSGRSGKNTRDDRRRGSRSDYHGRDWEDGNAKRDGSGDKRELSQDDREESRPEKKPRYEREKTAEAAAAQPSTREETPEEGEI